MYALEQRADFKLVPKSDRVFTQDQNRGDRLTITRAIQQEAKDEGTMVEKTVNSRNASNWSKNMMNILRTKLNNFYHTQGSSEKDCRPFLVDGVRVGTIPPFVLPHLSSHPNVFKLIKKQDDTIDHVTLATELKTFEDRSKHIEEVMHEFRKNDLFVALRGWRNECFGVSQTFYQTKVFKIERAAACLFGVTQYGVHVNGYFRSKANGQLYMWIARRSPNKPTGPGKLDQMVAGGITWRSSITETLLKECKEEAFVPEDLAQTAVPAGAVSFIFENEKGIFPGVQFVFDLALPEDFKPHANDGEVSDFYCWPIDTVKEKIATNEFKPNCALVVLDFLIRHGEINPQTEANYLDFIAWSHKQPY